MSVGSMSPSFGKPSFFSMRRSSRSWWKSRVMSDTLCSRPSMRFTCSKVNDL